MRQHHNIDPYPIPKGKSPLYINEPWLIDESMWEYPPDNSPLQDPDAVRVYVPLDLSKAAILRRLDFIIACYDEANEENEMNFSADVEALVAQIEVYDQIWYVRHMPADGERSMEAKELVREFIARLESIPIPVRIRGVV